MANGILLHACAHGFPILFLEQNIDILFCQNKWVTQGPNPPASPKAMFQQLKTQYAFGDELAGVHGTSVLQPAWILHGKEICGGMLELPCINLVRPPTAVRNSTIIWHTHSKGTRDYGTASTTTCREPTNGKSFKT